METVPLLCPQCGKEAFKTGAQPQSLDDLDGAVCAGCGHKLTQDDIRSQAREMLKSSAADAIRRALKR